jgi:hypothetical protein
MERQHVNDLHQFPVRIKERPVGCFSVNDLFVPEVSSTRTNASTNYQLSICVKAAAQWLRRQLLHEGGTVVRIQTADKPLQLRVTAFIGVKAG